MIRFTNKMFQLFKMQKYEFWRYLNILKQSVIQTGVGVACNAQSRAGGTLMVDFRTVLCQTEECPDVDIFIRYQIYRCRYCEAQARVRQGSARDGSQGERHQSLNPCLELTLKLVAPHPPTRKSHYAWLMAWQLSGEVGGGKGRC